MPVSTNCATHSNYLATKNAHPRDKDIEFDEPTHIYTCAGEGGYTSVTTFNHQHFDHFDADKIIDKMMRGRNWYPGGSKYFGMTKDEIKAQWAASGTDASTRGTQMHYDIECFYNDSAFQEAFPDRAHEFPLPVNDSVEYQYFKNFQRDYGAKLKPYRTEMMIYDRDLRLAGSIDMIYENERAELEIYDWKRSKGISKEAFGNKRALTPCIDHLPDSNFWHYSLQLNTYKAIIEKNYGKQVTGLYLVCLHPDHPDYQRIQCADLQSEIRDLFQYRLECLAGGHNASAPGHGHTKIEETTEEEEELSSSTKQHDKQPDKKKQGDNKKGYNLEISWG